MAKTFRDLTVWQRAHSLVIGLYKVTRNFPAEEKYILVPQMRRSVSSIAMNIVEGFKRKSRKDYAHFINIADTSLEETKYQIMLAYDLGYIGQADFEKLNQICDEVGKMLCGFYKKLIT